MSSVAQELCDQICEESPVKQSKQGIHESNNKKLNHASSSRYDRRPTRTITVEKKRVINKVVPSSHSKSTIVINKFKSKETLLKKTYIDRSLNTIVTGPLRCNNDCVTMVRKRDYDSKVICAKCSNKRSTVGKEIQTFDTTKPFAQLDKACEQCISTVNCSISTQVFENHSSKRALPLHLLRRKLSYDEETQTVEEPKENEKAKNDVPCTKSKADKIFMGARRWALSQYPTRGPDF